MSTRGTPATPEMLEAFLDTLAEGKRTRREIHSDPMMPTRWQVHLACKSDERFAELVKDAEIIGLEESSDELVEIADTAVDKDTALAARVRIAARQWRLEKLHRNVYGRANEQGGTFTHYVVELPAQPASTEEWLKQHGRENHSEIASLSGALNQGHKPH